MSEISKQAVAGVTPAEFGEALITEAGPSVGNRPIARTLATKIYSKEFPWSILAIIMGLPTLPIIMPYFALNLLTRYRLTTKNVQIRKMMTGVVEKELRLSDFDEVKIDQLEGQEFYEAADIQLLAAGTVKMTLEAVPNPEPFRQMILSARTALLSVAEVTKQQEENTGEPVAAS